MESLESKSYDQLKALAKDAGVKGYAQMSKAKLIAALQPAPVASEESASGAGLCPVTDAPCEKDCAKDECHANVSQEQAQSMIDSGQAEIPKESSSPGSDLENHPKFAKFKRGGNQP